LESFGNKKEISGSHKIIGKEKPSTQATSLEEDIVE
jgi:hypothetical protein